MPGRVDRSAVENNLSAMLVRRRTLPTEFVRVPASESRRPPAGDLWLSEIKHNGFPSTRNRQSSRSVEQS
jgi:hypothetical protein